MEGSTYSLTYKGSIPNAIAEAQRQKKLFVVYISGENENSVHLEQSTWADLSVAEAISKCCIFLHLRQGGVDASQFSAIYPQKSVPSISAIGLNGVMLWQHEGYISAENLIENIEKAWAALHLQETAMTLLTAALATKKPEPMSASSPSVAPIEQGASSSLDVASTSTDKPMKCSMASSSTDSKQQPLEDIAGETSHDKDADPGEETCSQSDDAKINKGEQSSSATNTSKEALKSVLTDVDSSATLNDVHGSTALQANSTRFKNHTMVSPELAGGMTTCDPGSSKIISNESEVKAEAKKVDGLTDCSSAIKSNDVHLSIRMPNGTSLQMKLTFADTLRLVKNFVDENQVNEVGSYDLAVPYPRKLFNEQDMNKTLSELGFASREALIVVPHRQAPRTPRGQPSSYDSRLTEGGARSGENGGGYFEYVKRVMSYLNPFSYFGGGASSSNSEPVPSAGLWQYRPNPAYQNPSTGDSARNSRTSRPFGSNIHTLRENEDENRFGDRNVFWNGNSTQFGGDDRR